MNIILLENESALKIFLKDNPHVGKLSYVALSDIHSELTAVLESKGYSPLNLPDFSQDRRDHLVKSYVEMIGEVNRRLDSRLWWATDFSSKNRFSTQLPVLVQKFLAILELSQSFKEGTLVICQVPWQIRKSLKKAFLKSGITYSEYFSPIRFRVALFERRLRLSAAHVFHFLRTLLRWAYSRIKLSNKLNATLSNVQSNYVIKCFVYTHSFTKDTGEYRDIFYGRLPNFLSSNHENIVFFANILGDFRTCIKSILVCPNANIVPLEHFLTLGDILLAYFRIAFYRPRINEEIYFEGHEIRDLLNAELVSGSGKIQSYQYLHYAETRGLLSKVKTHVFLMTYENNPWEKMCTLAIRDKFSQTKIYAYQHTVNPQASVNMFHSKAEEAFAPKPDRVMALGDISQQIIGRYSQSRLPIIEPACALQFEHLWKLEPYLRTKTKTILLGLEGIFDVYKMINYVLAQLKDHPEYKIIIRAHPVLPVKAMEHKLIYALKDLPNVEVSQGFSLLKDIERSDMMVYWGSMAALEAHWMGKPLIHFNMETIFSYDALFDSPHFKWIVSAKTKLPEIIEEIYDLTDEEFFASRDKAKEYLKSYFAEVNPAKLSKFLPQK